MSETTTPEIDWTIYPMPMFATFRVADIAVTEAFYNKIGFVSLATIPGPDGSPFVVHLRRMTYQDLLLVPGEPNPGSTTVTFLAGGENLETLARRLRGTAPDPAAVQGPEDTPWFTSDLTIDDPDGNRLILSAQREAEADEAREWTQTFEGDYVVVN